MTDIFLDFKIAKIVTEQTSYLGVEFYSFHIICYAVLPSVSKERIINFDFQQ